MILTCWFLRTWPPFYSSHTLMILGPLSRPRRVIVVIDRRPCVHEHVEGIRAPE
jgi:hypothetical protein